MTNIRNFRLLQLFPRKHDVFKQIQEEMEYLISD